MIGLLFGRLYQSLKVQVHSTKILETKHQLSLQFAHALDWDDLADKILQNFVSICQPGCAYLLVHDPASAVFEKVAEWQAEDQDCMETFLNLPAATCIDCTLKESSEISGLKRCDVHSGELSSKSNNSYCLPLRYGNTTVAVIHYHLPIDRSLSEDQIDLMNSISIEMAISLMMAQQRKILADIKMVEAALAERR